MRRADMLHVREGVMGFVGWVVNIGVLAFCGMTFLAVIPWVFTDELWPLWALLSAGSLYMGWVCFQNIQHALAEKEPEKKVSHHTEVAKRYEPPEDYLVPCSVCGAEVSNRALWCPKCGQPDP